MGIFANFVWMASFSGAAVILDRRQNLTQKDLAGQAGLRRASVNLTVRVNSTLHLNSTQQALPMNICPVGGIVPDKEQIKRAVAAGVVFPNRSITGYEAKVEFVRNVVQRGMKLSPTKQILQQAKTTEHEYVFITGLPYSGTTSLYGLLSTSPQASNLCKGLQLCCEGAPILANAGLWPVSQALNPAFPADWKKAITVYSKFWNMSKPILLEKSVNNMKRFPRLYQTLHSMGAKASFIYVVRSTCFSRPGIYGANGWVTGMTEVLQSAQYMRNAGAKVLIVKWEELVGNPYAVTQDLMNFLPELVSLDPTKNGLHDSSFLDQNMRAVPAATFSTNFKVEAVNQGMPISPWEQKMMEALGYTRQWFEKTSWLTWGSAFNKLGEYQTRVPLNNKLPLLYHKQVLR